MPPKADEQTAALTALKGFDIQGHTTAEQTFLEAYNAERLHHAWLITGPRGIGKASLAYKIARFLLHHPPEDMDSAPGLFGERLEKMAYNSLDTPPGSRENHQITAGSHGDLLLIQRRINEKSGKLKEEITVDDVRNLQGFFAQTAANDGFRIAIIDSADEMNRNAANALLKALEEPPKAALLILLAHAPGRLLPTITSRCQQLRLLPLTQDAVSGVLARHYPDLSADERMAYAILSDGSPGYAIHLFEQDGLALYGQILEILASLPMLNVPMAHRLADNLSLKQAEQKYVLFGSLLTAFLNRMIRHCAARDQGQISPITPVLTGEAALMDSLGQRISLDQWVDLWEKVNQKLGRLNLDRKQVILNILSLISRFTAR